MLLTDDEIRAYRIKQLHAERKKLFAAWDKKCEGKQVSAESVLLIAERLHHLLTQEYKA